MDSFSLSLMASHHARLSSSPASNCCITDCTPLTVSMAETPLDFSTPLLEAMTSSILASHQSIVLIRFCVWSSAPRSSTSGGVAPAPVVGM